MNLELTIPDMACSACADTIAKGLPDKKSFRFQLWMKQNIDKPFA